MLAQETHDGPSGVRCGVQYEVELLGAGLAPLSEKRADRVLEGQDHVTVGALHDQVVLHHKIVLYDEGSDFRCSVL